MSEAAGVSVAQWLREAAIAQLNFERGAEWARIQELSDPNAPPNTKRSEPIPESRQ